MILRFWWLPFDSAGTVLGKNVMILRTNADEFTLAHERYHQEHWCEHWIWKWLTDDVFRATVEFEATLHEYTLRFKPEPGTNITAWIRARAYETVRDGYWLSKKAKIELTKLFKGEV